MKKVISLILCIAMMLSFATVITASAKGALQQYAVDGTLYDATASKSGSTWSWDSGTKTLTLNGFNGKSLDLKDIAAKIVLNGDNTITASKATVAINSSNSLTIEGAGTLNIIATDGRGIVSKELNLNGGTIIISAGKYAIEVYDNSTLNVDGAVVIATAKTAEAIFVDGEINVLSGEVKASTAALMPAIVSYGMTEYYIDTNNGNKQVWLDEEIGDYGINIATGGRYTASNVINAKINVGKEDAYSTYYYYYDDSTTGAKWDVTQTYKLIATATDEDLTLDGKTWTYGGSYANDVTIVFPSDVFENGNIVRTYGDNRTDTALASAEALKVALGVSKFDNIIVANGRNYADALAGSYLAAVKGAPILLVDTLKMTSEQNGKVCKNRTYLDGDITRNIPYDSDAYSRVIDYIVDNYTGAGNVYILGSESAVSATFETILGYALGANKYDINRVFGANRWATNIEILKEAGFVGEDLIVCTGDDYADALSVSSLGKPILLVNNSDGQGQLFKNNKVDQVAYLKSISGNVKNVYFIGSRNAVHDGLVTTISSYFKGANVERVYGGNRYLTSKAVADKFYANANAVAIAVGTNFPDALSAGPVANAMGAPVLLVADGKVVPLQSFVDSDTFACNMMVFGSTKVVSDALATSSKIKGAIIENFYPLLKK